MKLAALAAASLAAIVLAAPTALAGFRSGPTQVRTHDALEAPLLAEINKVRSAHGLRPLEPSAELRSAADAHAAAMGEGDFFSHDSADGTSSAARVREAYGVNGFWRWSVGENLLWAASDLTPAEAVEQWLASPSHRRVLLGGGWKEIGISAVHVTNAGSTFGGGEATILVTDFGARA